MKEFLIKIGIWLVFFVGISVTAAYIADDASDPLYSKIASKPAKSLIIGSSRAAQGIIPAIIDSGIEQPYEQPSLNFAFSHVHSRFGPVYLRAIKKKLDPTTRNGLFILVIDPASITANTFYPEDTSMFPERETYLNTLPRIDIRPNFFFLFSNYHRGWGSLIWQKIQDPVKSHPNGWVEVTIPDDYKSCQMRLGMKIKEYNQKYRMNSYSSSRLYYFIKTIEFLKQHGKVILVRLPVHQQIYSLEERYSARFDPIINTICKQQMIEYIDYSGFRSQFNYTDGSHLTRKSAMAFSKRLVHDLNILNAQTTN